ncbi:MAG TPA: DUF815 domain-containing protein [Miltoncostaeaceae bacterium]|nr:DUF815 domain-containing protein [Miltoncostaeaceae bacterium]
MGALEGALAAPGDGAAAAGLAAALFTLDAPPPRAVAGLVLGSDGPFARLARRGLGEGDGRVGQAAAELDALGRLAHADLAALLARHGLTAALPAPAGPDGDRGGAPSGTPPAAAALVGRLGARPGWGAHAVEIARFHRREGTGHLALSRVLRFRAGALAAVERADPLSAADLIGGEARRRPLEEALDAFVAGGPPIDALLYGPPGTGKSATVRALAAARAGTGLRLVQLDRERVADLPALFEALAGEGPRCLVLLDDLVFDEAARTDRALRAALEGDAAARPGNVAVWATSNRMRLLHETRSAREEDVEEALGRGERAALATRFALRVAVPALGQDEYLAVALGLAGRALGAVPDGAAERALRWARERGATPRAARQFADALAAEAVAARAAGTPRGHGEGSGAR